MNRALKPGTSPNPALARNPDNLLAILQGHLTALDAIYCEVRRCRSINLTAIRQLHQVIVVHQPTYRAYSPQVIDDNKECLLC